MSSTSSGYRAAYSSVTNLNADTLKATTMSCSSYSTPDAGIGNATDIVVQGGASTSGNAGAVELRAGAAADGDGGNILMIAGTTATGGDAGYITILSGDHGEDASGNIDIATPDALISGEITIETGAGNDESGFVRVRTGGAVDGDAGPIEIEAGNSTNGQGGDITIESGNGDDGGNLYLYAGTSTGTGNDGGDITIYGGSGNGAGIDGRIIITRPSGQVGFFTIGANNAVSQQTATGASGYASVGGSAVSSDDTFTGGSGATAYTIGDIVLALKNYGLLDG